MLLAVILQLLICSSGEFPKGTEYIATDIIIAPRVTHKYTMTFKLQGTGTAQNEDQGKTFQGKIDIEL